MDQLDLSPSDDDLVGPTPATSARGLSSRPLHHRETYSRLPRHGGTPGRSTRLRSVVSIPPSSSPPSTHSSLSRGSAPEHRTRATRVSPGKRRASRVSPPSSPSSRSSRASRSTARRPRSPGIRARSSGLRQPSPRSPRSASPRLSEWTVAGLQRALRKKGIRFHRSDNKGSLFKLLFAERNSPAGPARASLSLRGLTQRSRGGDSSPRQIPARARAPAKNVSLFNSSFFFFPF